MAFYFESVVLLTEITKDDDQRSGNNFCNGWVEMKLFNKQFYEGVIQ